MHHETVCADPLAVIIHWDNSRIQRLDLRWSEDVSPSPKLSNHGAALQQAMERYVRGESMEWPGLPFAMERLSPFSAKALQKLRTVRPGTVVTYGELAAMAGSPNGARAAGRAMATNPWPLVYPCHRVVGAGGKMTGFSGADGIPMKEYLLRLEGAIE
jgi:methylated-DNA-[protein]-cysteine S-methyltransferase